MVSIGKGNQNSMFGEENWRPNPWTQVNFGKGTVSGS